MKRIIYIFVALITLSVGIIAFYLSPKIVPVSVYTIVQNFELYQRQRIYIKGYLEAYKPHYEDSRFFGEVFDYERFCLKDCIAGADIDLTENIKNNEQFSKTVYDLAEKNNLETLRNGQYFILEMVSIL